MDHWLYKPFNTFPTKQGVFPRPITLYTLETQAGQLGTHPCLLGGDLWSLIFLVGQYDQRQSSGGPLPVFPHSHYVLPCPSKPRFDEQNPRNGAERLSDGHSMVPGGLLPEHNI